MRDQTPPLTREKVLDDQKTPFGPLETGRYNYRAMIELKGTLIEDQYVSVYTIDIPEESVISGTAKLHVKLSTEDVDKDNLIMTADNIRLSQYRKTESLR